MKSNIHFAVGASVFLLTLVSLAQAQPAPAAAGRDIIQAGGGKYQITIDTSATPDLTKWAETKLAPVVKEWYPKIVKLLPSKGFEAPRRFSITFSPDMRGVAATGGTHIHCAARWFRQNLKGQAVGAVVHEMVHVVQQYGRARWRNPDAKRTPGWLVEGIADYVRWFLYEPQSHGADLVWMRRLRRFTPRYNASYRVTANFLNWVTQKYDADLVPQLNAAARAGRYTPALWTQYTGHTVQALGSEWKQEIETALAKPALTSNAPINTLTPAEKAAGWELLFDGKDFKGWHNFRHQGVRPGWQIKNGAMCDVNPHDAEDLVTTKKFKWFELQLDYKIVPAGNSGIMYHVTNKGFAIWATGPEFQLEDNAKASDPWRCGWLYGLYKPPIDPKTGKRLDATKPAGQWNHIRLLVTPKKCEHDVNGVKYFTYVLGSKDFNERVAHSKFHRMRYFAKSDIGFIGLQGDHGRVCFRNIKIRPIHPQG